MSFEERVKLIIARAWEEYSVLTSL
jgi:hypothetical protein